MSKVPHIESLLIPGGNAFRITEIYSSASIQVYQCKTPLCNELGQKQDLKLYRNYYDRIIRLS